MISRRQFIFEIGSAAAGAVIAPAYYRSCRDHVLNTKRPLIVAPANAAVLYAENNYGDYKLLLGDEERPPVQSWREFFENYDEDCLKWPSEELEDYYGITRSQLDENATGEFVEGVWLMNASPNAQAYSYLSSLNLGPLKNPEGERVGALRFMEVPMPGSSYVGVHADDEISLSCLQERLNQLGEKIRIEVV